MTTLRDDGYLETDDPVVQACFLNRFVQHQEHGWASMRLTCVYFTTRPSMCRIPASTVAEVTGYRTGNSYDNTAFILINHLTMSAKRAYQLVPWLRKHTQAPDAS